MKHNISGTSVVKIRSYACCLLFSLWIQGCITPFEFAVDEDYDFISIEGSLIKGEKQHMLVVSKTATLDYPEFKSIDECIVNLLDNAGNTYEYHQNSRGEYLLDIHDSCLVCGREYKIRIETPSGKVYESDFETLSFGVDVDTVYYREEQKYDRIEERESDGIQFYIDLKAADTISRYYMWDLEETYEIYSIAPITYYFVNSDSMVYLEDMYEFYHCWKTSDIRELYLSDTRNLVVNEKKSIPLVYVTKDTDRLKVKYSLLVQQYTLSEGAYLYWKIARNETQESGGLYDQQPSKPVSNIHCLSDPGETVLGYFWLTQRTDFRIFVPGYEDIDVTGRNCQLYEYQPYMSENGPYPMYIYKLPSKSSLMTSSRDCFNCMLRGGTLVKPDFWE